MKTLGVTTRMANRIDWTTSLGQAYVNQSTDVMTSIQRLRRMTRSVGNLVTTPQQQVIVEVDYPTSPSTSMFRFMIPIFAITGSPPGEWPSPLAWDFSSARGSIGTAFGCHGAFLPAAN